MSNQIITLSNNAANRIKEIISKSPDTTKGVRVGVKSGGCAGMSYVMEYVKDLKKGDELIEDKGYDLDEETISSLTKYVETNLSSLCRITEILNGITAYKNLIKQEEEKIESLGGV